MCPDQRQIIAGAPRSDMGTLFAPVLKSGSKEQPKPAELHIGQVIRHQGHLGQVVTNSGPLVLNHGQDQRIPLHGDEILQISGIQRPGVIREIPPLQVRDVDEESVHITEFVQPTKLLDERLQIVSRGALGYALEAIEGTAAPFQVSVEEVIQLPALLIIQAAIDEVDEDCLALAGHVLGNLDQGRIGRKFHAATQQLIDDGIDEIDPLRDQRRGGRGRSQGNAPTLVAIERNDAQIAANGRFLTVSCRRTQCEGSHRPEPHDLSDVLADLLRNVAEL